MEAPQINTQPVAESPNLSEEKIILNNEVPPFKNDANTEDFPDENQPGNASENASPVVEQKRIPAAGDESPPPEQKIINNNNINNNNSNNNNNKAGPGRGGGRLWNVTSPNRFRGRGYNAGGNSGMMRGRGPGCNQYYRGRGGGHMRFPPPNNVDGNWPMQGGGGIMGNQNPLNFGNHPGELWVETKSEDGKTYFYHAITRETTWTKPEGPNIRIMTQTEIETMNAKNLQGMNENSGKPVGGGGEDPSMMNMKNLNLKNEKPNDFHGEMMNMKKQDDIPPGIPNQPPFMSTAPPNFNGSQFGMPPPGYPSYNPAPWSMPWGINPQTAPPMQEQPAKNLIIKPGVIDPIVIARAAEWTEHRAPDGRPYYYHAIRGESVWEKPQAIRDLEAARMAAHSGIAPQAVSNHSTMPMMNQNPVMTAPVIPGLFDPMSLAIKQQTDAQNTQKSESIAQENESKEAKLKTDTDKKHKEEEDKNKTKPIDKSRPISSTAIAGTPWCVVWTGDGRVFFYNPSTRTSVWERPEELLDREDVDKAISTPPEQLLELQDEKKNASTGAISGTTAKLVGSTPATGADLIAPKSTEVEDKPVNSESSSESETPAKKMKIETKIDKKQSNEMAKEAVIEAEVRAAKERAMVPLDVRVKSFKEMLREKDVSAFSTWEKELHKIVFDPRYLLLTSKERKQVFEKYVKERAEEERKEKRNKMRQKREDFRKLLESSNLHGKSTFNDFILKHGKDERYKAIEKIRERESLFNEYILEVRRREKEEKLNKREQIKKDFIELLRERSEIDRHTRWSDIKKKLESDPRYRAIDSSTLREDYFLDYIKSLKDERRKQKNQERDKKDKKEKKDKRSKDVNENQDEGDENKRSTDYGSDDDTERQQKERERQMRAEQSIKEREKEVQRTLASHLRDRDKEREHHKRDEAIRHFNALLSDLVRNADLTWKEVKRQLRKDHRWELIENLDREDRERIFAEHIDTLIRKKRDKFREMLDELIDLNLTISWKDVKKSIKDDPRYLKYSSSEKCEREFKDYIKDKTIEAKTSLRELLQECKLITHKSFEIYQENANHLKDIEDILKNDKRYLILEHIPQQRTQMILTYLEDLHKRGPPPPPTASESSRRK